MLRSIRSRDWSGALRQPCWSRDSATWRIESGVKRDGVVSAAVQTIKINACRRAIMREIKSPNVVALTRLATPANTAPRARWPTVPAASLKDAQLLGQMSHADRRPWRVGGNTCNPVSRGVLARGTNWPVMRGFKYSACGGRAPVDGSVNLVAHKTRTVKTHCYAMLDCE